MSCGVHREGGDHLTPESIFGFSQITIAQTAKALAARGVAVEVVGITPDGGVR